MADATTLHRRLALDRRPRIRLGVAIFLGGMLLPLLLGFAGEDPFRDPLQAEKKEELRGRHSNSMPPETPAREEVRFVEAWRFPLGAPLSGPLLPLDPLVVASMESERVDALSLSEGRPLWKVDLAKSLRGGPVDFGGHVVQATTSGEVVALDPGSGETSWNRDLGSEIAHGPTVTRESLLVPLAAAALVSLNEKGGERWRVHLRSAPSTPIAACRGFVVVGTEAGTVEAYDRESGRQLWIFQGASPVRSQPLCRRGLIFFGTADYRFTALRYSGRRKWSYKVGGDVTAAPFVLGNRVYFLCFDNYLYALNARTGSLLLKVRLSHRLSDSALRVSSRLYLSPYTSARLLALALPDLALAGEYKLDLEGDWFTTPPVRAGDRILIGYGRYEGRILALREEAAPPPAPGS